MKFIKTPYLPEKNVELCIAGDGVNPYIEELSKLNVSLLLIKSNTELPENISNHADLSINYAGNGILFAERSQKKLVNELNKRGLSCKFIDEKTSEKYPDDCLLNCFFNNEFLFCNKKYTSKELLNFAEKSRKNILDVKQGYVKCSVCPVSDNAYITDDEGIFFALQKNRYDVLLVKKGSVTLNGYNYGFIGGCCGKISENEIVFFGDVKKHSSYNDIKSFVKNYKIDLISLGNGDLIDIGSIIPISEHMH